MTTFEFIGGLWMAISCVTILLLILWLCDVRLDLKIRIKDYEEMHAAHQKSYDRLATKRADEHLRVSDARERAKEAEADRDKWKAAFQEVSDAIGKADPERFTGLQAIVDNDVVAVMPDGEA